ncbi:MAG: hypothetical protein ACK58T_29670 [Phycisphaerae bacterium]
MLLLRRVSLTTSKFFNRVVQHSASDAVFADRTIQMDSARNGILQCKHNEHESHDQQEDDVPNRESR